MLGFGVVFVCVFSCSTLDVSQETLLPFLLQYWSLVATSEFSTKDSKATFNLGSQDSSNVLRAKFMQEVFILLLSLLLSFVF